MAVKHQLSESSVRLFTAIPLREQARAELVKWTSHAQQEMSFHRWVHPLDYHITLQFLGDTKPDQLNAVVEALQTAVSQISPMELSLNGFGTFGQRLTPRILWAGVGGNISGLEALLHRVFEATKPLGFRTEDRPYRPHITLAKKYAGDMPFATEQLERVSLESVSWVADRMVLYRTHMTQQPMYECMESFSFTTT